MVLKSYSLAEADKIVVILTKNHGVVRGVARGAKRLKSRFGGALEIFSIVQLSYFQKEDRELVSIRQIELLKSYFEKAGDSDFLESFTYVVELLIEFAQPNDPNERLYRMTKVCLDTAAESQKDFAGIIVYFQIWLLKLGGYLPDWSRCFSCKKALEDKEKVNLQTNFNVVCAICQKSNSNMLSVRQREIFLLAQRLSPKNFLELSNNQTENIRHLSQILKRFISNILGKETFTEKILSSQT